MKFIVTEDVFQILPTACFGVVVAKGLDNRQSYPQIEDYLQAGIIKAEEHFIGKKVKEETGILPYRQAFQKLGINPNKYMCSIEALFTRIAKGKGFPTINAAVDLGNSVSLSYTLPIGAHDIGNSREDIQVRFSRDGDTFIPFGGGEADNPPNGELVYAVGSSVRTRRWTWRQSEIGKISEATSTIFYPIDGFIDVNKDIVLKARDELAILAKDIFGCEIIVGYVDQQSPEMVI